MTHVRPNAWVAPGLVGNYTARDDGPWLLKTGVHVVKGLEIPFLPEPAGADTSRATRMEAGRQHRMALTSEMRRMAEGLYDPAMWRNNYNDNGQVFVTYDLRISNMRFGEVATSGHGAAAGPTRLRLFLLVRAFILSESGRATERDRLFDQAERRADDCCRRMRAQGPRDLPLKPIEWVTDPAVARQIDPAVSRLTPAMVGLGEAGCSAVGELRRRVFLSSLQPPYDNSQFRDRLHDKSLFGVPVPWRPGTNDLLPTCTTMSTAPGGVILSVRIQSALKTKSEIIALRELYAATGRDATGLDPNRRRRLREYAFNTMAARELFVTSVQVAGEDRVTVAEVLNTLAAEQAVGRPAGKRGGRLVADRARVARVLSTAPDKSGWSPELAVALHNLTRLDFLPWGAASLPVHQASVPPDTDEIKAVPYRLYDVSNEHLAPDWLEQRDIEIDPRLARFRQLLTLSEVGSIWRVPIVGAGGHAGLASRPPDPFEQLPADTPPAAGTIRIGRVQHRGVETSQVFRMPFDIDAPPVAALGDRVTVVAGSPGSGKTNFCIDFLSQLWNNGTHAGDGPAKCPYLVIDPTRGNEFRSLLHWAPDDLVVFTVGDSRGVPFCFNPFIVPIGVSVQSHISRLMCCFKAAFHMWDPLPAIFELAIRRAYKLKRAGGRVDWNPAKDWAESKDEPFPTLRDLKDAMTVEIAEQRKLWGEGTENSATIVASTTLRLENLYNNYDHVIGGPGPGRECYDVEKLLDVPTVLELGVVGESSALSLIMGFLLVCLAGTIENPRRDRSTHKYQMLVIEEAHRLLGVEGGGGQKEGGNSKAQAAEDINNMLAEVRKFGLGVMLLDQRPASLVGGVIDNAYMVAMHRLNEQASFKQFSEMLNLSVDHQRFARTELRPGEMITLDRRTGLPVLTRAPLLPKEAGKLRETADKVLAARMQSRLSALILTPFVGVPTGAAERIAGQRGWPELLQSARTVVERIAREPGSAVAAGEARELWSRAARLAELQDAGEPFSERRRTDWTVNILRLVAHAAGLASGATEQVIYAFDPAARTQS